MGRSPTASGVIGRKRWRNWPQSTTRAATPVQAPASGAEDARGRQRQRAGDGRDDEDRAAPQVERRDRGRIADAPAEPIGLLIERVEAHEQEEARDREDDHEGQLRADRQRHVGDEQQPDHDHGIDRPPMPERRVARELGRTPGDEAEHQQVMAVRGREQELRDDQVRERPHGLVGRGLEQKTERSAIRLQRPADQERRQQRGEHRPDRVRGPATPPDQRADAGRSPPHPSRPRTGSPSARPARGRATHRRATTRASRRRAGRARS